MKYTSIFIIVLLLGSVLMYRASIADTALAQHAECIGRAAIAQGYIGNVHSAEAWELFNSECVMFH